MSAVIRRLLVVLIAGALVSPGTAARADDADVPDALGDSGPTGSASGMVLHGLSSDAAAPVLARASTPVPAGNASAVPSPSSPLPTQRDLAPTYQAGVSCDPVDRPGATALGRLLLATYATGVYGISRYCNGSVSEHHEGRAVDWMLDASDPAQAAVARSFLTWLTAENGVMAGRLGVQYVIWDRRMWRAYAPERGWTAYSGASPHTDHIHISLTWDGAMSRTSWWSGRALTSRDVGTCRVYTGQPAPVYAGPRTTPCPSARPAPASPWPVVAIGSRDQVGVRRGQTALGVTADGVFGRGTQRAVLEYQRAHGLPTSGAFDNVTWNLLLPRSTPTGAPSPNPAPAPSPNPTGAPSPAPSAAPEPRPNPAPPTPPAPPTTPSPPAPPVTSKVPGVITRPLEPYRSTVLRPGQRHAAVPALQRALRIRTTGRMDTATVSAVRAVQRRWGLRVTGVVDLRTWNRVELTRYPWLGYTTRTLRPGSSGPAVAALQQALAVGRDGRFGPRTAAAVTAVQTRYGLPADAVVDARTWRAITHAAR